jgi:hypothetical protein
LCTGLIFEECLKAVRPRTKKVVDELVGSGTYPSMVQRMRIRTGVQHVVLERVVYVLHPLYAPKGSTGADSGDRLIPKKLLKQLWNSRK